ncbi:MAG: glycosyltransferase family 4 protein [Myxococcales bacterium]|nr:glycosyltransferase family 4 protein [Myxococcales bacterium]
MSPPKILHVVSAGELGGAERMLFDLVRHDTESAHAVALYSPSDAIVQAFRERVPELHVRRVRSEGPVAMLARAYGSAEAEWLERAWKSTAANVLHLHTFGAQVVGARVGRALRAPIVRTEHSTRVFDDPSCWALVRSTIEDARVSCSVSEAVRRVALAKAGARLRDARVVPNGVDVDTFSPLPRRSAARKRVAIVGRIEPRKGVDIALEALAPFQDLEIDIVGDGPDAPAIRALARSLGMLGRTRFRGHVTDVHAALGEVDLVVSGARKEGLGLALLEAMAARRLVVATPTGGVPEFLQEGRTGFLAANGSKGALSRAVSRALAVPEATTEAILDRAATLVLSRFSVGAMCRAYAAIYRELLAH